MRYTGVIAKSRNSQKTQTFASTKTYNVSTGALISDFGDGGIKPVLTNEESIAYANGGPKRANFCIHKKITVSAPGVSKTTGYYSAANPTVNQVWHMPADYTRVTFLSPARTAFDVALGGLSLEEKYLGVNGIALMTQKWDKLQPTLEELSVPNFLIDIEQLKGLHKLWQKRRELSKNFANLNLNIQFGWKPLLGDVQGMVNAMVKTRNKIKLWQSQLGNIVSRRVLAARTDVVKAGGFGVGEWDVYWRGSLQAETHAYIRFRPLPIVALNDLDMRLRGLLTAFGFNLNPRIVWDAIPFSFIVDWFYNVGGFLNNFRIDTLELPFKLEDTFLQYKESYRVDVHPHLRANTDHKGWALGSEVSYERKVFHRMHAAPSFQSFLDNGWKIPSPGQAVLGLSLLRALRRR